MTEYWGQQVDLGSGSPVPPCGGCGGVVGVLREPTGPHHARLNCNECGRFLQWLSPEMFWQLLPASEWEREWRRQWDRDHD